MTRLDRMRDLVRSVQRGTDRGDAVCVADDGASLAAAVDMLEPLLREFRDACDVPMSRGNSARQREADRATLSRRSDAYFALLAYLRDARKEQQP